jgi:hypothetical protein
VRRCSNTWAKHVGPFSTICSVPARSAGKCWASYSVSGGTPGNFGAYIWPLSSQTPSQTRRRPPARPRIGDFRSYTRPRKFTAQDLSIYLSIIACMPSCKPWYPFERPRPTANELRHAQKFCPLINTRDSAKTWPAHSYLLSALPLPNRRQRFRVHGTHLSDPDRPQTDSGMLSNSVR